MVQITVPEQKQLCDLNCILGSTLEDSKKFIVYS